VIALPPLRHRLGDLAEIVNTWLDELASTSGRRILTEAAWEAMRAYDWPGNVRELRQAVIRAVSMGGAQITPHDLFPDFSRILSAPRMGPLRARTTPGAGDELAPFEVSLRELMRQALAAHGTIRAAAISLGMPKSTFAEKAERFGLLEGRRRRGVGP
jgi:DNA-binding NtrC family response regulator